MQPDYTFALQYKKANMNARSSIVSRKLKPNLSRSSSSIEVLGWKPECLSYTSNTPTRLLTLANDLNTLALTAPAAKFRLRKADIIVDLVASNLGFMKSLSAPSTGPFRLCGKTAQLLSDLLLNGGTPPTPSPTPQPSPSPGAKPPSPSPAPKASPSPSPGPNPGELYICFVILHVRT
jgi:hypothetical protein